MISAVAKMIEVHPQTLRLYERMGLVGPLRLRGKKRRYSYRDIEVLRFIRGLTRERGINLAGVKLILDLQQQIAQLQKEMRETLEVLKEEFYDQGVPPVVDGRRSKIQGTLIKIENE